MTQSLLCCWRVLQCYHCFQIYYGILKPTTGVKSAENDLEADEKISVDLNTQKEEFSYAYLYAIASPGGYSFQRTTTPLDRVGIDLILTRFGFQGLLPFPQLYVQLKCTSRQLLEADALKYPLRIKNYNELRNANQYPPIILAVVVVPDNLEDWLQQSEQELCLRRCIYWISLAGAAPTENQETVTISISKTNVLTVNVLNTIMQRIAQYKPL